MSLPSVLRTPEVASTLVSSLLGRLPLTVVGLLLLLHVRDLGGGYARAGLVVAVFSVALALGSPVVGRLVDARGQTAVLVVCAIVAPIPLVAIALSPEGTALGVLVVLAALAGFTDPPLGGCLRALWQELIRDDDRRHAAYVLESTALEGVFILGPLLMVGVVAALSSPATGLLACAGLMLAGTLMFARTPSSRAWRPAPGSGRRRAAGALASAGLVTLLAAVIFMGASFGAIEVATASYGEERDQRALIGPLLAAWGLGSLIGGLVLARRGAPADAPAFMVRLLAAMAIASAPLALAPNPWALAALLALAGFAIAPTFATMYGHMSEIARAGTLTESYTWVTTAITGGLAGGQALTGLVVDASSPRGGLAVSAVLIVGAAVVVSARRSTLQPAG